MDAPRQEPPTPESDDAELASRLRALARAQHQVNLAVAQRLGLGANDLWALEHLAVDGPLGPAELGHRLGIRSASATTLVDRLEAAGHVERHPHPSDRRRLAVTPTERAAEAAYEALAPLIAGLDAAAAELTPAERAAAARYLDRVTGVMRSYAASQGRR
jgi:DNA-binding MarR family transcriptional regulator